MRTLAFVLVLGGCAEPAIELTLRLPAAASVPESFDLKCITAIDVVAFPENAVESDIGELLYADNKRPPCVELSRPPENFTDIRNAMKGQFDIPIPVEGLLGVAVRGRVGTCTDESTYHEAIFYGGAVYRDDADSLTVPLVANISCNTKREYEVRPVDLLALTMTKTCPAPITDGVVFAGNIRPTLLDPKLPPLMFESGSSSLRPMNGTSLVGSFTSMAPGSCVAMGYDRQGVIGATCINAGAPTVCGEANELEVPIIEGDILDESTDQALANELGPPSFVGVWEIAPTKTSVAGATVTLADPDHGRVVYLDLDPGGMRFTPRTGATGGSGMLAVYVDRLMEITITAPGHGERKLLVGGTPQMFGTALAVLPRI